MILICLKFHKLILLSQFPCKTRVSQFELPSVAGKYPCGMLAGYKGKVEMICENCNKNVATSYCLTKINGQSVQKYLCQQCRESLKSGSYIKTEQKTPNKFCHNCGTTLKDFIASSYVGCQQCYTEFSDVIEKALKSVQIKQNHVGKVPLRFLHQQQIKELEDKLNEAMDSANFDEVKILTKQLSELKGGNGAK